jgi:y4mF family transcriptional regulator
MPQEQAPFAIIVRQHRKRSGLSQRELAELAGVGMSSVYEIERGKATVRYETLLKVCSVLNISITFTGPFTDKLSL